MLEGKFTRFGNLMDRAHASFIERRFIAALLLSEDFTFEPMNQAPHAVARDRFGIVLGFQVPVGPYFVDFTLTHPGSVARFVVELDGHAWHRRTAKEAEYETRRERVITEAGWTAVRYMGGEVMRDPRKVADDAYGRIFARVPKPGLSKASQSASMVSGERRARER